MANNNSPFGFKPHRHLSGGDHTRTNQYTIASAYASNIFTGDCVKSTGSGNTIALAGEGDTIRGVFMGCSYTNAQGEVIYSRYWPASTVATNIVAHVADDPNIIFLAMAEGSIVAADEGLLADLDNTTAGSAATGTSGHKVGAHDGSEGTFKIYRILEIPVAKAGAGDYENDGAPGMSEAGNYALVEVIALEHELRSLAEV